jgi:hypothetical protein
MTSYHEIKGDANSVIGDNFMVRGNNNTVLGNNCIAYGDSNVLTGANCHAFGRDNVCNGVNSSTHSPTANKYSYHIIDTSVGQFIPQTVTPIPIPNVVTTTTALVGDWMQNFRASTLLASAVGKRTATRTKLKRTARKRPPSSK